MTDSVKTMIYAGVAVACAVLAFVVTRPPAGEGEGEWVNKPLFEDFTDSQEAASLEIVKVDEKLGKLQTFQVDRSKEGLWVIPSHGGYPADATDQMRDAATSLINLNVIAMVSDDPTQAETYGVVEPTAEKLEAGAKGFGLMVSFEDKSDKSLAKLIVGSADQNQPNLRFVRKAGQDPIYVVELNVDKFSTKFEDWIEKDLLKISPWDIDRVTIKDYQFLPRPSADGRVRLEYDPRLDLTVGWDADANSWVLDKLTQYQQGKSIATDLSPEEELNKEKLDELKTTIDTLQIVDVRPKPAGLGGDLSVDDAAAKNEELLESLQGMGYYLGQMGNKRQFLGTNGDLSVGLKDGVEYILRFGNSAGTDSNDPSGKPRRFLFVLARLDESRLKPPALEKLPDAPADVPEPPATQPGTEPPPADAPPADTSPDVPSPAEDAPPADDVGNAGQDENPDEPKTPAAVEPKAADAPQEEGQPKESAFDLKRKQIERENQRKLDDYSDRRKKAAAKVRELNARFAPWYYVISDEEFRKIHLTKNEVIKERSGPGQEGFGPDAFHQLKEGGINAPPPAPPTPPGRPGLPPGGFNFPPM